MLGFGMDLEKLWLRHKTRAYIVAATLLGRIFATTFDRTFE